MILKEPLLISDPCDASTDQMRDRATLNTEENHVSTNSDDYNS